MRRQKAMREWLQKHGRSMTDLEYLQSRVKIAGTNAAKVRWQKKVNAEIARLALIRMTGGNDGKSR